MIATILLIVAVLIVAALLVSVLTTLWGKGVPEFIIFIVVVAFATEATREFLESL